MADAPPPAPFHVRWFKVAAGGFLGMCTGAVAMYANAFFDRVIKPSKPVANFAVAGTEGLTATFDNRATGDSGWWDFGDGTALEPFEPTKPTVAHTYPKPGGYSAKLVVRNFLMEETDRSVSVDLSNPPNLLSPAITGMAVEPFRETIPATYKITGQIANADEVVWKYGDKTEQVVAPAGAFEKFVTIDKPGQQPIVLTALSKTKKDPQVFVHTVSVTAPTKAVYDAEVIVSDAVTDVQKGTRPVKQPVAVMEKGKPTAGFDRTIQATPGWTITGVNIDPKTLPMVKNLKAEVTADKKSVRVTGQWADSADKVMKAAGGGDVTIAFAMNEEKSATGGRGRNVSSGVSDATGQILVRMPQMPSGNVARTVKVDFGLSGPTGRKSLLTGTLDTAGNWSAPLTVEGKAYVVKATMANGMVRVVFSAPGT